MTNSMGSDYKTVWKKRKDFFILQAAESIIHWDMETKMPPKAVEQRSLQLALLSRISHQMSTDPEIGRLLKQVTTNSDYDLFSQIEKRNIYLIKKNYEEQTALPEKLVSEITRQQAVTVNTWKKAKKANKFTLLKPELEKLLNLTKQEAEVLMKVKQTTTTYEALIDGYEPKMSAAQIAPIFTQLQQGLKQLISKIQSAPQQSDTCILHQNVPIETQQKIATTLAQTLGYDTTSPQAAGRIDETEHPFTSGQYDDVRITTHYFPTDFASSIFSVLHETGHALYDHTLNPEWKYQPIGTSGSGGIHESQSRFVENIIRPSREIWLNSPPQ